MEKADSSVAQMRKGVLEMCVLAIIGKRESYASDILNRLKEARLIVVEGTLYPILSRLKNDGSLSYRWEESNSGPPRKYYSITTGGLELLAELSAGWKELTAAIEIILLKQEDSSPNSGMKDNAPVAGEGETSSNQ